MPLVPEMEFHMNNGSWPGSGGPKVYMTPNKVWGPLFSFAVVVAVKIAILVKEVFN